MILRVTLVFAMSADLAPWPHADYLGSQSFRVSALAVNATRALSSRLLSLHGGFTMDSDALMLKSRTLAATGGFFFYKMPFKLRNIIQRREYK